MTNAWYRWLRERRILQRLSYCLCILLVYGQLRAEPKGQDAAVQQVLRKAQGVVRQLTQDKALLEAEKNALVAEKGSLEGRLKAFDEITRQLYKAQSELGQCRSSLSLNQSSKASLEVQLEEKHKSNLYIASQAKDMQAEYHKLMEDFKDRGRIIDGYAKSNTKLLDINHELLDKFNNKGLLDEISDVEPITGIGQVRTDAISAEYKYKLHQLKMLSKEGANQSLQDATGKSDSISEHGVKDSD